MATRTSQVENCDLLSKLLMCGMPEPGRLQVVFSVFAIMQDPQRTLVDLAGVFASQFGERILTPGLRSRDQDVFWSFHPPPRFVLVNTFTATRGQSGGPPVSSKRGHPKESKAGRPVLLRN